MASILFSALLGVALASDSRGDAAVLAAAGTQRDYMALASDKISSVALWCKGGGGFGGGGGGGGPFGSSEGGATTIFFTSFASSFIYTSLFTSTIGFTETVQVTAPGQTVTITGPAVSIGVATIPEVVTFTSFVDGNTEPRLTENEIYAKILADALLAPSEATAMVSSIISAIETQGHLNPTQVRDFASIGSKVLSELKTNPQYAGYSSYLAANRETTPFSSALILPELRDQLAKLHQEPNSDEALKSLKDLTVQFLRLYGDV